MSDILRSVGLDVGTTSTQMIFSELTVENKASGFAVPEMEIARRDAEYLESVLEDNVNFLALAKKNGINYILIEHGYKIDI